MLPIVGGVYRQNPSSAASSTRLVPHRDYTWSMGWDLRHVVHGRTNGMGFLSPYEYTADKRAVAMLGDSFVEAEMLSYDESLAGRLDSVWGGRAHAFNFGQSGASLPHYLGMAREMAARFQFAAAIVVVTPDDYTEGFEAKEGMYSWGANPERELIELVPAVSRSRLTQFVREMALVRYTRANLRLSPSRLLGASKPPACSRQPLSASDRARLTAYVDALPRALRLDPGRIVMVFHVPVAEVYERVDRNRPARTAPDCADIDTLARAELEKLAASRSMQLIDVTRLLEDHYRVYRRPLDFRPVDAHWNGTATAVIAREIARLLADPLIEEPHRLERPLLTAAPGPEIFPQALPAAGRAQ
jgi:hypothetical protein